MTPQLGLGGGGHVRGRRDELLGWCGQVGGGE